MKSETGALLTKISAIIDFVAAGIVLLIGIVASILIGSGVGTIENNIPRDFLAILIFLVLLLASVVILVIGLLLFKASKKMLNPKTTRNGAIWAIVLGVITLGNVIGILALIGGIIGLSDANK